MKYDIAIRKLEIEKVGQALHALNKEAKRIRDLCWYQKGDFGGSLSWEEKKKYSNDVKKLLDITDEEYGIMYNTEIIHTIKRKESKLYNLKEKVIQKAIQNGIEPKGYHVFESRTPYGWSIANAMYIEIGGYGFHYDICEGGYPRYNYNAKKLGTIEGGIEADYNIEYTEEMEELLKKYINE